jgi:uncharacterized membrane protein YraQ (UPF0718 family)
MKLPVSKNGKIALAVFVVTCGFLLGVLIGYVIKSQTKNNEESSNKDPAQKASNDQEMSKKIIGMVDEKRIRENLR